MLISMLSSCTAPGEPLDVVVALISTVSGSNMIEHSNRNSRRVDSSSSLVEGDSLYPMPTILTLQRPEVSLELDVDLIVSGVGGSLLHDAVLSAETESQLLVSSGELTHEDLGICSALGGPYLYDTLHDTLLELDPGKRIERLLSGSEPVVLPLYYPGTFLKTKIVSLTMTVWT